jgi:uncharacterized protein
MLERPQELAAVRSLLRRHPIVGIIGARQIGKTTLARQLAAEHPRPSEYFDLEDPGDIARLADPMLTLRPLRGLVILDEIHRLPGLFTILRVLADRPRRPARFLVLGSASPELLQQSAETLAGRIAYHELSGFTLGEIGAKDQERLWLRGGFPRSYLAHSLAESFEWRSQFVQTFLERDMPQLGLTVKPVTLRRFWTMLAHYHGQTWNASEFARSFGVADTTVRRYLDGLTFALVVRRLQPWFANVGKRQVKAPKVYLRDSGLMHALLNLRTLRDVQGHPKLGASWEGFVLEQVIHHLGAAANECFFWATHTGAELDLLVVRGNRRIGLEIKRTSAPALTPSMRSALTDLDLQSLTVVHAGEHTFALAPKVRAVAASRVLDEVPMLSSTTNR